MSLSEFGFPPFKIEGQPIMWDDRRGLPNPGNMRPFEYQGKLFWVAKGTPGAYTLPKTNRQR